MLVPIVFEENENEKLMPGGDLFRLFTGIRAHSYRFHDRIRGSDKPDIPARQSSCFLNNHSGKETMYLRSFLVVGPSCFGEGFLQSSFY